MKRWKLVATIAAGLFAAALPAEAQDVDAGAEVYKSTCRACHGPTAKGLASYPKLAGRSADYLVMRLQQYRSGERLGPNTPLMAPMARQLSDADIANLATYIATEFN
ncbi:MAG: cytochrome c [Pseudomonadota bacterium]